MLMLITNYLDVYKSVFSATIPKALSCQGIINTLLSCNLLFMPPMSGSLNYFYKFPTSLALLSGAKTNSFCQP